MEEKTQLAFGWYVDALARQRIPFVAPKHTDVRKTYVWRTMLKFVQMMEEWRVSEEISKRLLDEVIIFSARKRSKSTLLMNDKVLQKCLGSLGEKMRVKSEAVRLLKESKDFFEPRASEMLLREREGAWPNLVMWHRAGSISLPFLALSKRCNRLMKEMLPEDRRHLPNIERINALRIQCLMDKEVEPLCAKILGADLVTPQWRTQ